MKTRSERPGFCLLVERLDVENYLGALLERKNSRYFQFFDIFLGKSLENRKAGPSIWLAVFSAASKMPTHCCELLCTKKGYREEETGEKVSYFKFPTEEGLRKLWIHAIWRDMGKNFQISNTTKVCSRHFKSDDLRKSFNGIVSLRRGAVPSVFAWKQSSPCKRPPPTPRILSTATTLPHNLNENISKVVETAGSSEILEISESSSNSHLAPEIEELQSSTNFDLKSEENLKLHDSRNF